MSQLYDRSRYIQNLTERASCPYVDTLHVLLAHTLNDAVLEYVKTQCPGSRQDLTKCWRHRVRLSIQRPNAKVLRLLRDTVPRQSYLIARVDFAVDLLFATEAEALKAQQWHEAHHYQTHHGKQRVVVHEHGRYSAQAGAARNWVVYADRESKIAGGPSCHIEYRIGHAASVCNIFNRMLDRPKTKKVTFADLLRFSEDNVRSLFKTDLRYAAVNGKAFERRIDKQARMMVRKGKRHWRTGNRLDYDFWVSKAKMRLYRVVHEFVDGPDDVLDGPVQWLRDAIDRPSRYFTELSNTAYLPNARRYRPIIHV